MRQKTKNKKIENFIFLFSASFLGSNGLGTPPTTIKVEDSASNEPLGSSGDCNRTQFSGVGGHTGAMLVGPLLMERPYAPIPRTQNGWPDPAGPWEPSKKVGLIGGISRPVSSASFGIGPISD